MWKIVSASVLGPSHESSGVCDDSHWAKDFDGCFVAIASDGAGSAKLGNIGSNHIVDVLSSKLSTRIEKSNQESSEFWTGLKEAIFEAIEFARESALSCEGVDDSNADAISLADLHATVVGAVVDNERGLFFHIGDGYAIAVKRDDLSTHAISHPENGEYADTTYFYTEPNWREHLRFIEFEDTNDVVIALMTDGTAEFAISKDHDSVDKGYFGPISDYFSLESIEMESACSSLEANLASDGASKISGDDKTLVWACMRHEQIEASSEKLQTPIDS